MKTVLLHTIRLYQRHLSARKGYACACRVHTGRASCSALGYRAIRRHGARRGLLILLLFAAHGALAFEGCTSMESENSGTVIFHPPPSRSRPHEAGTRFQPGAWLALACNDKQCRLAPVTLKVETQRFENDAECPATQWLQWDFSNIDKSSRIVMLFKPGARLKVGEVKTWYVWASDRYAVERFRVGEQITIPTPRQAEPERQSVLTLQWSINSKCTEKAQAAGQCMKKTARVQLQEGSTRQWLGEQLMGMPWSVSCALLEPEVEPRRDFLLWAGDLDGDDRPDYLLSLGRYDGYVLFLSSAARPGELAREAGRYYWPYIPCD